MAITVIDKAGNATITDSGSVTSIDDPVISGSKALQFNFDTDAKISFAIPDGIGTDEFTIQGFISIATGDSTHGGNNHPNYYIDIGGIQVRIKTTTVSNELRVAPTALSYGSFKTATNTGVSPNEYFHFRVTRDSSGDIKFWEGDPTGGGAGSLEHVLATSNSTNMNGQTIEIGDLGGGQGAMRLDALEVKTSYAQSTGTAYIIPETVISGHAESPDDSSAEDIRSDTLVLIDGTVLDILEGTVTTSASATVTAAANVVNSGTVPMSITSGLVAQFVEQGTANISADATVSATARSTQIAEANLAISGIVGGGGQDYVDATYIVDGYFISATIDADILLTSVTIPITTSMVTEAVESAVVDISVSSNMGSQNYVASDYIEENYFESTTEATVIPVSVTMPITASMVTAADETDEAEVNLSIATAIGTGYTEAGYITIDYFEHTITAQDSDETGAVALSSSASLSADADAIVNAEVSASIVTSISAIEAGSEQPGTASLSSTASMSVAAVEILAGTVAASIAASTSITANATVSGEITADIALATSIAVNATNSGEIQISSAGTMTINAFKVVEPIYSVKVPTRSRVNSISEQTKSIIIPRRTKELEFY